MSRKRFLVLMGFLLLVILVMGGYLYFFRGEVFRGEKNGQAEEINVEEILEEAKREPFDLSKSITKMVGIEDSQSFDIGVPSDVSGIENVESRYFIRGLLVEDVEVGNGLLGGKFYIKGDELKREITLVAGAGGKVYFGYVEDKEDGVL